MNWNDLVYIAPELVLTIGASILLVMPVLTRSGARIAARTSVFGDAQAEAPRELSARTFMLVVLGLTALAIVICSWVVPNVDQSRQLQAMS